MPPPSATVDSDSAPSTVTGAFGIGAELTASTTWPFSVPRVWPQEGNLKEPMRVCQLLPVDA